MKTKILLANKISSMTVCYSFIELINKSKRELKSIFKWLVRLY